MRAGREQWTTPVVGAANLKKAGREKAATCLRIGAFALPQDKSKKEREGWQRRDLAAKDRFVGHLRE